MNIWLRIFSGNRDFVAHIPILSLELDAGSICSLPSNLEDTE